MATTCDLCSTTTVRHVGDVCRRCKHARKPFIGELVVAWFSLLSLEEQTVLMDKLKGAVKQVATP